MDGKVFTIGGHAVSLAELAVAGAGVLAAVLILVLLVAWRRALAGAAENQAVQAEMRELVRSQSEMQGRMQTMAEVFGSRQADLVRGLSERMDGLGHKLGQSMLDTTRNTHENLSKLAERLAVIDTAQKNITALSSQVVELQHILANKQTRGAFGQARMEAIVQDGLPTGAYAFQATLSNGTRPDCVILFPNGAPPLVVDAKFPLEAWNAIRAAGGPDDLRAAETRFRRDTQKHIQDIADRYLITGETQDTAFMFVPSESIFADLHERFEDIIQKAHRARVVIVSPSLLMLSVQVMMSLLRDVRMREQAHLIQKEVARLMEDVGRVDERVRKLQLHFNQATKDIDDIRISTQKVTGRGEKIVALDLGEDEPRPAKKPPPASNDRLPELPFRSVEEA